MSFNFSVGMSDYCLEPTSTGFSYHHPSIPTASPNSTMHNLLSSGHNPVSNTPNTDHGLFHSHNHTDTLQSMPSLAQSGIGSISQIAQGNTLNGINGFTYHQEPILRQDTESFVTKNVKKKTKKERKRCTAGSALSRAEVKRRRNAGEEYVTRKGKLVGRKEYQPIDCKCRLNCTQNVTHDMRKLIFDQFHALADWNNQTQFIVSSVSVLDVKRRYNSKNNSALSKTKRSSSRLFYLTNKKIRVCKPVFLSALGITNKRLDYALRHKALPLTSLATPDFRGKKCPLNKTPAEVEDRIKSHIKSFPKSTSLAGKSGKTNQNMSPDLTISKMYSLYQEQCLSEGIPAASMWVYAKIFHSESKVHLGTPKKSLCKMCERIKIIVHSGDEPEKIVQMLLKEFQDRPAQTLNSFMDYSHPDFSLFSQKKN